MDVRLRSIIARGHIKLQSSPDAEAAFHQLQQVIVEDAQLARFDERLPIEAKYDASLLALGVTLLQVQ